jgi:hypothetical protein
MLNRYLCLITLVLGTAAVLFGQDTFKPRDGNEALAMRLHDWYVQSQTNLTNLRNELPRAERNARQFINLPGDHEDLDRLNEIKADIEREQIWSEKIAFFWGKNRAVAPASALSFAGRYGPLSESGKRSSDPKYDQIEAAIRNFPFNDLSPKGPSLFDGPWLKTKRQHTDGCGYSAESDMTISTDATGVTRAVNEALANNKGKVVGKTLNLEYGIVNGIGIGTATFTISEDGKSFTGTFSDKNGHRGNWSGKR